MLLIVFRHKMAHRKFYGIVQEGKFIWLNSEADSSPPLFCHWWIRWKNIRTKQAKTILAWIRANDSAFRKNRREHFDFDLVDAST